MTKRENTRIADDILMSLVEEPQRWEQDAPFARVRRNDGLIVWKDGSGVSAPRRVGFSDSDQSRVAKAIAEWELGPLKVEKQP